MFSIRVNFRTGDSFGSCETSDIIGFTWKNIDAAIESLKRIREHGDWSVYDKDIDSVKDKPWFVKGKTFSMFAAEGSLYVVDDEMKPVKICAFWSGYFEKFYSAQIIVDV